MTAACKHESTALEASPLWSVMIPTYRPDAFLEAALLSARASLDGAGTTAQLEIVDDASPDVDVEALLRSWGLAGIAVHRRPRNGGLAACWNTCIERARGTLVHILHQDDLVKPGFYGRLQRTATAHPQAAMVFCRTEFLDADGPRLDALEQPEDGVIGNDWLARISAGQRLQCPSVVVRRETYRRLGGFDPGLRFVIDWEMWVRIAADSPVAYVPEALAVYRIHQGAETQKIKASAAVSLDMAKGLRRIRASLERAGRRDCVRLATEYVVSNSGFAVYDAEQRGDRKTATRELWTSIRHLGVSMGARRLLARIKWYIKLRLN